MDRGKGAVISWSWGGYYEMGDGLDKGWGKAGGEKKKELKKKSKQANISLKKANKWRRLD